MRQYALITGASSGIGLALAHELASRKHNVLLVSRSADKLNAICVDLGAKFSIDAQYLVADLSSDAGVNSTLSWLKENNLGINILINNAGYGIWGAVEVLPITDIENMMHLNMHTMVKFCHALIPELKKHHQSYILNVASTAAYQAVPTLSVYAASKAFVILFTRALRWELKGSSISVSCLSPGTTSTGFMDRAKMKALEARAEKFSMSADVVARIAIAGMLKEKAEIIPGFINWISVKLTYLVPKFITEKIARDLYKVD